MSSTPTVRNIWWMAMWSQDLAPGQLVARRIMDEPLVFYRLADGSPTALYDRCAHRWAPLSRGKVLADDSLQCPYHGLQFDPHGVCIRNPHPNYAIPSMMRVRSYPLAEKHSAIWIWMGTGTPDESLIPDFSWLDYGAPDPIDRRAYLLMPSAWDLMVDNLLDLSHIALLHDGNLGHAGMLDADTLVEQHGRTKLRVRRQFNNIANPVIFDILSFRRWPRVDIELDMTWVAPSCLTNNSNAKPAGGTALEGTGVKTSHFLTPETDTTCHYHFAATMKQRIRSTEAEEAEAFAMLRDLRQQAFVEQDGVVIAAQQIRLLEAKARGEDLQPVLISADAGVERAHRMLRDLFDEERKELQRT
jgi:phenylpropionate dioxygenase-like ring-hydroxylating dioxygenase large terminal subunit